MRFHLVLGSVGAGQGFGAAGRGRIVEGSFLVPCRHPGSPREEQRRRAGRRGDYLILQQYVTGARQSSPSICRWGNQDADSLPSFPWGQRCPGAKTAQPGALCRKTWTHVLSQAMDAGAGWDLCSTSAGDWTKIHCEAKLMDTHPFGSEIKPLTSSVTVYKTLSC